MRWLVMVVLLGAAAPAEAGSFRGGAVWWRVPDPAGAPNTVEVTVTTIWDQPTTDATTADLDLGDGTVATGLSGPVTYTGSTTLGEGYAVRQTAVMHTYAAAGTYTVVLTGCCRHATTNNIDGALPFKLTATIALAMRHSPVLLTLAPTMTDQGKPLFAIATAFGDTATTAREATPAESGLAIPELPDGLGMSHAPSVTAGTGTILVSWYVNYSAGQSYELGFVTIDARGGSSAIDVIAEVPTTQFYTHCDLDMNQVELDAPPGQPLAVSGTITPDAPGIVATIVGLPTATITATASQWHVDWTPASAELGTYRVGLVELASPIDGTRAECGFAVYVLPPVDECTNGTADCAAAGSTCTDTPWGFLCACHEFWDGDGRTCTPVCRSTNEPGCITPGGKRYSPTCCGDTSPAGFHCTCAVDTPPPMMHDGGGCEATSGSLLGFVACVLLLWRARARPSDRRHDDRQCGRGDAAAGRDPRADAAAAR